MTPREDDRIDELLRVLNSTPVVDGEARELLEDRGRSADLVREVRRALQSIVRREEPASILQGFLADVRRRPVASEHGIDWVTLVDDDQAAAVDLALTWSRVERTLPGRLRPCANPECTLFLLDRSRGGAGRWCSMSACGNRAKARRHYERHRSHPARDSPTDATTRRS